MCVMHTYNTYAHLYLIAYAHVHACDLQGFCSPLTYFSFFFQVQKIEAFLS